MYYNTFIMCHIGNEPSTAVVLIDLSAVVLSLKIVSGRIKRLSMPESCIGFFLASATTLVRGRQLDKVPTPAQRWTPRKRNHVKACSLWISCSATPFEAPLTGPQYCPMY